jgi:hypothetical protein
MLSLTRPPAHRETAMNFDRSFQRAQRMYDAQTPDDPEPDPTENMTDAEYAAALMRWLDAGAPERVTWCRTVSREDDVRAWLADFVREEQA